MSDDATAADATDDSAATERRDDPIAEVRQAIEAVRREALKAAAIEAVVYATLATLLVNLGLTVVPIVDVDGPVPGRQLLAAVVGLTVVVARIALARRRPAVERFEAANPEVREALRTARDVAEREEPDAVAVDRESPVVGALCTDVVERLRATSSRGLVAWRRVTTAMGVVVVIGVLTVGLSVAGAGIDATPTDDDADDPASDLDAEPDVSDGDLRDGESVLGEETAVDPGTRSEEVSVGSSPGGQGDESFPDEGGSATSAGGGIDTQEAGYAPPAEVDDADLIADYTRALDDNE